MKKNDNFRNIPVLQYLKEPIETTNDLYTRYPLGGEYGWFAFVLDKRVFAYWDTEEGKWLTVAGAPTAKVEIADIAGLTEEFDKYIPVAGNSEANPITGNLWLNMGSAVGGTNGGLILNHNSNPNAAGVILRSENGKPLLLCGANQLNLTTDAGDIQLDPYGKVLYKGNEIATVNYFENNIEISDDGNVNISGPAGISLHSYGDIVINARDHQSSLTLSDKAIFNGKEIATVDKIPTDYVKNGGQDGEVVIGANNSMTEIKGSGTGKIWIDNENVALMGDGIYFNPTQKAVYKGKEIATVDQIPSDYVVNAGQTGAVHIGSKDENGVTILGGINNPNNPTPISTGTVTSKEDYVSLESVSGAKVEVNSMLVRMQSGGSSYIEVDTDIIIDSGGAVIDMTAGEIDVRPVPDSGNNYRFMYRGKEVATVDQISGGDIQNGGQDGEVNIGSFDSITTLGVKDAKIEIKADDTIEISKSDENDSKISIDNSGIAAYSGNSALLLGSPGIAMQSAAGASVILTDDISLSPTGAKKVLYRGKEVATVDQIGGGSIVNGGQEGDITIRSTDNGEAELGVIGLATNSRVYVREHKVELNNIDKSNGRPIAEISVDEAAATMWSEGAFINVQNGEIVLEGGDGASSIVMGDGVSLYSYGGGILGIDNQISLSTTGTNKALYNGKEIAIKWQRDIPALGPQPINWGPEIDTGDTVTVDGMTYPRFERTIRLQNIELAAGGSTIPLLAPDFNGLYSVSVVTEKSWLRFTDGPSSILTTGIPSMSSLGTISIISELDEVLGETFVHLWYRVDNDVLVQSCAITLSYIKVLMQF